MKAQLAPLLQRGLSRLKGDAEKWRGGGQRWAERALSHSSDIKQRAKVLLFSQNACPFLG